MFQTFFGRLGRLFQIGASIILILFLIAATWLMAYLYQTEKRYNQFIREGQPVTVHIQEMDREPREVGDQFVLPVYARFTYNARLYEVRCIHSNPYSLSVGMPLHLLYHPDFDSFEQPRVQPVVRPTEVVSPLLGWTISNTLSVEHQLLAGLIIAASFLFFILGGLITMFTGPTILQPAARGLFVVLLTGAAQFFTYDTVALYRYVRELKTEGQRMIVQVTETNRRSIGRRSTGWYTYRGAFLYGGQLRTIAIAEQEYDRLHDRPGPLTVRYHPQKDDFVSEQYAPDWTTWIAPLFFWVLLAVVVRNSYFTRSSSTGLTSRW